MSNRQIKNLAASVSARLRELARKKGEDFQFTLARYGIERFLYRLSKTRYHNELILKGAMSFRVWSELEHRATRDADFLGLGEDSIEKLRKMFEEIISGNVEDDALVFNRETIEISDIMEGGNYHGKRITIIAFLGKIRIPLQLDIGFGDAVTPDAKIETFPPLLDFSAPEILVYPRETIIAEKFEAIVSLGMINSRMKDYFDLLFIANTYAFDYKLLKKALANTFQHRKTTLSSGIPVGLSDEFKSDSEMNRRWLAFTRKTRLDSSLQLPDVVDRLRLFLLPLSANDLKLSYWPSGGPWR